MIFDTHAHYDDERFDEDRAHVLEGLFGENVGRIVNVGASLKGCIESVGLSEKYDFISAAVGIHPEYASVYDTETEEKLKILLENKKCVALGEIGLDYYWDKDCDTQIRVFKRQLELARCKNLPVIIHSRDAAEDTFRVLNDYYCSLSGELKECPGVVHCFSYSRELAAEYVKRGFLIGIGGVSTFKNSKKLKEVIDAVPIRSIVTETDCPYMAPEPMRGKRNYSGYLKYVIDVISDIKGISKEETELITWDNACRLYRM